MFLAAGAWQVHTPFNPGIGGGNEGPPSVRDTQLRTAILTPNMGWTTSADCGDSSSPYTPIHFRNKETPTTRLANAALHQIYGRSDVPAAAPLYASAVIGSGSPTSVAVTLKWDAADAGPLTIFTNVTCPGVARNLCGLPGSAMIQGSDAVW